MATIEGARFGAGVADEDIEGAELGTNLLKHAADFLGLANVGLHDEAVGAVSANLNRGTRLDPQGFGDSSRSL